LWSWTAAFKENTEWQGLYDYNGQSVKFTLAVHSASDDVVMATLRDRITKLELIGLCSVRLIVYSASFFTH